MSDHVNFLLAANSSRLFSVLFFPSDPPQPRGQPRTHSQNSTTALVMLVVLRAL